MASLFNGDSVSCCQPPALWRDGCICSDEERVIRAYATGRCTVPMTPAQREHCHSEAYRAAEGALTRQELEDATDQELARALLGAWAGYCRSQGLL